ncbi:AraC family transcriptional regulator [Paenibacillus rigui]|uniref:HTH araC/xylS-type domain-containing protein n=1 Tax=Paenibacillus rigui TaxID=554312 RepID=A0A229UI10_9BACL|nr:AraC family transcriptional regulator [Paenibacillus rigui]OXM83013.1 hypothetical protein CF651_27740 [Paenibacillus rigui]
MKMRSKTIQYVDISSFHMTLHMFQAHRRKSEAGWSFPKHNHQFFELNMVLEGTQYFNLTDRKFKMTAGDILFIKPDEVHSCHCPDNQNITYVCMHFNVDEPQLRQSLLKIKDSLHPEGSPLWEALYPALMRIDTIGAEGDKHYNDLKNVSLFLEVISAICRTVANPMHHILGNENRYDRLASRIAKKITSLADDWAEVGGDVLIKHGIKEVAEELGYHPTYCTRVFKSMYGVSPRDYISNIKLRESKLLLSQQDLTIEQVAARLGYRDVSYFSKQFKRWTNLSPSDFRRRI